jgi:hypothetical protein
MGTPTTRPAQLIKVADQRLIDDGHARAALVLEAEIAPHEQRDSESLEVLRRYKVSERKRRSPGLAW